MSACVATTATSLIDPSSSSKSITHRSASSGTVQACDLPHGRRWLQRACEHRAGFHEQAHAGIAHKLRRRATRLPIRSFSIALVADLRSHARRAPLGGWKETASLEHRSSGRCATGTPVCDHRPIVRVPHVESLDARHAARRRIRPDRAADEPDCCVHRTPRLCCSSMCLIRLSLER